MKGIVAVDSNLGIGVGNDLAFRNKDDLKWFKQCTVGEVCVAGYNTYQTVKHLQDRTVLLYNEYWKQAFTLNPEKNRDKWIIGGAATYKELAPLTKEVYITFFKDSNKDCDVFLDVFEVYAHLKNKELLHANKCFTVWKWS